MASEGGGKIKGKRNQTSSKPYDRNKSFLGKIKSSVKDYLIPSWLSTSFAHSGQTADTQEDNQNSTQSNSVEFSNSGKNTESPDYGSTQDLDDSGVVIFPKLNQQQLQRKLGETNPSTSLEAPPPNVNIAAFYQGDARKSNSSEQQASKSQKTQRPSEINASKDRLRTSDTIEEESKNLGAETAVRPIMVFTGASSRTPSSELAKRQKLWSHESVRQGRPFVAPVTDRPSFNSSLFGSPNQSNMSMLGHSSLESSFYSGKTRYGGAAAERKSALPPSPYQSSLPLRKQVKANPLNTSLNATTSLTAQRILETLDRMSTPLGDAKKIPQNEANNDSVLSFTPSSYRRTSFLTPGRSRPLQLPNAGAPKSQHQSISQALIAKNRNKFHLDNRPSSLSQDTMEDDGDSSRLPTSMEPALSRVSNEVIVKSVFSSSGKIKDKRFSQHISSRGKEDEEVVEVPNLRTDFTLPITNLNPIPLHTASVKSHSVASSSIPTTDKPASLKFTFSTPIEEKRKLGSNMTLANVDQGFKFSSPIKASNVKINAAGAEEGSKSSPEPAVGASSVVSTSFSSTVPAWGSTAPRPKVADIGGTSSSFKTYNKWPENDSSAASDVVTPTGFSLAPASSLKTGSVMDILGKDDLMLKFKKPPGSWECNSCMVVNKPEASKCVSCDTPKPGAKQASMNSTAVPTTAPPPAGDDLMSKFRKPPGAWECQSCLIQNKPEASKCVACETPRAGSNQSSATATMPSTNSLGVLFKKPVGNWECDTCLVQNVAAALKCAACESPKPGLQAAGVVSKAAVTSKASAIAISPAGGFVINLPTTTTTTVGSGGFKFDNAAPTSASTTVSSGGFKFGDAAPTSASTTVSSGGFKFGDAAPTSASTTVSSGGFKFGDAAPTSASTTVSSGGFKFGDAAPTLSSTKGFEFGQSATRKDSSDSSANNVSVLQTGGFKFGNSSTQSSGIVTVTESSEAKSGGGFVFGSSSSAASNKPNIQFSAVAGKNSLSEPTTSENHSLFNGGATVKSISESVGFQFGTVASSSASVAVTDTTSKVLQVNFNTNSPANPLPPSYALSTSQPMVGDTATKSANSLFQFGATPSLSNSAGLGMNSLGNSKPLTNGGFSAGLGVLPAQPKALDGANSVGFNTSTAAPAFGGFGSSVSLPQPVKRSVDLGDADAPTAQKTVHFGSINSEASTNGLFTFGVANVKTPAFGTNASSAANPSGGFVFGTTPNVPPVQANASQGAGLQFAYGNAAPATTNIFTVNAASEPGKTAADIKNTTVIPPSFNFGGASQQSAAPFKFGAPSTDTQSSSSPFQFGSTTATNPPVTGAFNIGAGDPGRRKIKAVRKHKK